MNTEEERDILRRIELFEKEKADKIRRCHWWSDRVIKLRVPHEVEQDFRDICRSDIDEQWSLTIHMCMYPTNFYMF